MRLTYFEAPVAIKEGSVMFHAKSGFYRNAVDQQRCLTPVKQTGLDAAGRRKRARLCRNQAFYALYLGPSEGWADPRCTQHFHQTVRKSTPKET